MRELRLFYSRYDGAKPLEDYRTLVPGEILMVQAYDNCDCGWIILGCLFVKVLSAEPPKKAVWFTDGHFGEAVLQLPSGQTVSISGGTSSIPDALLRALKENCCRSRSGARDICVNFFSFNGDLVELKETMQKYQQSRDAYRKQEAEQAARLAQAQRQREQEAQARRSQSAAMANEIDQMFRNSTK